MFMDYDTGERNSVAEHSISPTRQHSRMSFQNSMIAGGLSEMFGKLKTSASQSVLDYNKTTVFNSRRKTRVGSVLSQDPSQSSDYFVESRSQKAHYSPEKKNHNQYSTI